MPEDNAPGGATGAPPVDARAAALQAIKEDPFGYSWLAGYVNNVLELSAKYPDRLPIEVVSSWVMQYWSHTASDLPLYFNDPEAWDRGLRAFILSKLPSLVDQCTACELAHNRLPKRGSCTGEGTVDAKLFLTGEAPGAFEQRTGIPLTGVVELRSSTCATKCAHFWQCWNPTGTQYVRTPTRPCDYTPVALTPDEMHRRMARQPGELNTAGNYMSAALKRAGFTRRSFVKLLTVQQGLGMQKPDLRLKEDVYITNATKCRSTEVKSDGMIVNAAPSDRNIEACRPWLEIQMTLVRPQARLAMGSKSLGALQATRKVAMEKECGPGSANTASVETGVAGEAYVTLHPAYWMRKPDTEHPAYIGKLDADLRTIMESVRAATPGD